MWHRLDLHTPLPSFTGRQEFDPREPIVIQGQASDCMYVIRSGQVGALWAD